MLLPRCIPALQSCIKDIDNAYDSCNEAWARGEADKFRSKEFLTLKWEYIYIMNQTASLLCDLSHPDYTRDSGQIYGVAFFLDQL